MIASNNQVAKAIRGISKLEKLIWKCVGGHKNIYSFPDESSRNTYENASNIMRHINTVLDNMRIFANRLASELTSYKKSNGRLREIISQDYKDNNRIITASNDRLKNCNATSQILQRTISGQNFTISSLQETISNQTNIEADLRNDLKVCNKYTIELEGRTIFFENTARKLYKSREICRTSVTTLNDTVRDTSKRLSECRINITNQQPTTLDNYTSLLQKQNETNSNVVRVVESEANSNVVRVVESEANNDAAWAVYNTPLLQKQNEANGNLAWAIAFTLFLLAAFVAVVCYSHRNRIRKAAGNAWGSIAETAAHTTERLRAIVIRGDSEEINRSRPATETGEVMVELVPKTKQQKLDYISV